MVSINQANTEKTLLKLTETLKSQISMPEWANFVKTGANKERVPQNKDWWYRRAASILLTIYKKGPIGTSKLRTKYGSKKNRGFKPERFMKGSGKIIRTILQQLEKQELIIQKKDGVHKGRVIAPKGEALLSKNVIK